jgi:hypothetical protein
MGRVTPILTDFTGGELTPLYDGRVDTKGYFKGCKKLYNMMARTQGPAQKRAGTYFIGRAGDDSKPVRVIPFEYSTEQAYILELGETYMRVHKDGGVVTSTGQSITGATAANPVVITYSGADTFSNGDEVTITGVVGMTQLNGRRFVVASVNTGANTFALKDVFGNNVDGSGYTAWASGGTVAEVYEVVSPWAAADLAALKFVQSADTMYFAHPSYPPYKLARTGHAAWTFTKVVFDWPAFLDPNDDGVTAITPSAATGSVTLTAGPDAITNGAFTSNITGWDDTSGVGGSISWNATGKMDIATTAAPGSYARASQSLDVTEGGNYRITFTVSAATPYPVLFSIGNLSYYDVFQGYYSDGTHSVDFVATSSVTISFLVGNPSSSCTIDNVSCLPSLFTSDMVGGYFKLTWELLTARQTATATAQNTFTAALAVDPGAVHIAITGTWVATVTLQRSTDSGATWADLYTWTANTTATITEAQTGIQYRLGVKTGGFTSGSTGLDISQESDNKDGYCLITAVTNAYTATATVIEDFPATTATDVWAESAWSDERGWPSAVAFFEQRLVWAGTSHQPQTLWGSAVDDYENLDTGEGLDSDSWAYTLAADRANVIRWLLSGEVLIIGTAGAEWRMGSREAVATTPTSVEVRRESSYGSADIQALLVGKLVVFIQGGARKARAMQWDLARDGYVSPDLTMSAEHLFRSGVVDMAYAQDPDPVLWFVDVAGLLVAMTVDPDNQIVACASQDVGGVAESVAVIPGTTRDEVWVVVKRVVNSNTYRYIEQLQFWGDTTEKADGFFVDAGLTYSGASATTVHGLEHLEGETVSILADGAVRPQAVVSAGKITIATGAVKIHAGLPFTAMLQTMRVEAGAQAGTAQGKQVRAHKAVVRVFRTMGMDAGPSLTEMDTISFRDPSDPMGASPPLYTGDKAVVFPSTYGKTDRELYVCVQSADPLPLTVLAIMPVVNSTDS